MMKSFLAFLLCILLPGVAVASEAGYKVNYDGGSLTGIKTGSELRLLFDQTTVRLSKSKTDVLSLPVTSITEISYGQDVHRRVGTAIGLAVVSFGIGALMALSKSKKHYVGLTWADGTTKGGVVLQCDKNEYRGVLAGLEGVTGKKAVDSDTMTVKN